MIQKLQQWAAQRGYRVAWGSREGVERVRQELAARRADGELNEHFFESELAAIVDRTCEVSLGTVVLVAKPRPAHQVSFVFGNETVDTLLPPTYFRYRAVFEDVRRDLAENGLPGARVEHLPAPLKALAARLGLTKYGRNNISYAPDMGSYLQLCGYLTDAALPDTGETRSLEESLLPECDSCSVCVSLCPTRAISEERMLIRAERCLTFANENPGSWPEWVSPRIHHCLLGCLECQLSCPANPELPVEETGLCFSASETEFLLSTEAADGGITDAGIQSKFAWVGQTYAEPVIGRNLRALKDARQIRGGQIA